MNDSIEQELDEIGVFALQIHFLLGRLSEEPIYH